MAAVNALNLPESYPFRDPDQTPLLNDSLVQALTEEQSNKDGDEEGGDSPSMKELAEQTDSHVEVINVDNSGSNVAPEGPNDPEINLVLTPPPNFWRGFLCPFYSCSRPPYECAQPMMP